MRKRKLNLSIHIRPYLQSDYAAIKEIYQTGGLFEEDCDLEDILAKKSERDPESLLVAVLHDKIVGTVSLVEDGRFAFIFRLAVKLDKQNRGIGSQLIAEAEKKLKQRGNTIINILVNEQHQELQSYYTRRHFHKGRIWRWMWKEL